jgi:omega-6 fatty acid desaturase (delta-12 desaturase)
MNQTAPNTVTPSESRALANRLGRYRTPDAARSVFELLVSWLPFILLWGLMWAALDAGYWLALLLAVPAA